ncbi:MAG: sulfatase [Planctomycetaceae bacterium]|nr:sulfatase [Planctomycetaceae bacterium]
MLRPVLPWLPAIFVLAVSWCSAAERPNIVLILCDNLGYGDVGCYGSTLHRTPHIDQLAADGTRFTHFYVSSGVCTPSRASLMTGCYPRRIGLQRPDNPGLVLQPVSSKGLNPNEVTIAEVLKESGYATSIIGKWHLGDQPVFLPTQQGFDEYLGIPYSDDMTPREGKPWPPLPLLQGEQVLEAGVDRNFLTQRYTEAALEFIRRPREQPFFLFLSHAMPGSTAHAFARPEFQGRSKNGPWGDSVEELDWSTGEITRVLNETQQSENTLVIWMSDNGAPRRNPPQGSNAPLKGWGYDTSEGAMRVPCLIRWPAHVPARRTCNELCTSMDLLPTLAHLAGADLSKLPPIDGLDITPVLQGEPEPDLKKRPFYYYFGEQLQAVRLGPWKLYLPLQDRHINARGAAENHPGALFHLVNDIGEEHNLIEDHPDLVARMLDLADAARKDLGDVGHPGRGERPAGFVSDPQPLHMTTQPRQ